MIKKGMFINADIEVDQEDLSVLLKEECAELERFFEEDDQAGFRRLLEATEATMYYCMLTHKITDLQYQQITNKYKLI